MSNKAQFNPLCPGFSGLPLSRQAFLKRTSMGFGWLALSGLMGQSLAAGPKPKPHFAPKARNVIFLFMDGGVSHVDSFDPKPELDKRHGQPLGNYKNDSRSQAISPDRKWLKSPWNFKNRGQSGLPVSSLFPFMAECADDLCLIRSVTGETPLHGAQNLLLHTGRSIGTAPSLGSWVSYGLGTENENLPGYVLLNNDWVPNGGMQNFASSFLPATHQATMIRARGIPVDNIVAADPATVQDAKLKFLAAQDAGFVKNLRGNDAIESAIKNYEVAAQMQTLVPELADLKGESESTRKMYGIDRTTSYQSLYATQCLRARRLVEAGVRFVEITCPLTHSNNAPWDQHGELKVRHEENALITDQPIAALLKDLKARGLLEHTLVLWAGEMGRTPHSGGDDGRDHHVSGYTLWMAGGGVKGGTIYGATDELGMAAVENIVTIHDIHATILHLLGLDHERLTFRFGGRDVRLTDVHGEVMKKIFI